MRIMATSILSLILAALAATAAEPRTLTATTPPAGVIPTSLANESHAAIARGLDWLAAHQQEDGAWSNRDFPALIADRVSVGHHAVVHGCTVETEALIGIRAVVLTGAHIGAGAVVAAGSVVREGQRVEPGRLVAGTPAAVKKSLSEEERRRFVQPVANYRRISGIYRKEAAG